MVSICYSAQPFKWHHLYLLSRPQLTLSFCDFNRNLCACDMALIALLLYASWHIKGLRVAYFSLFLPLHSCVLGRKHFKNSCFTTENISACLFFFSIIWAAIKHQPEWDQCPQTIQALLPILKCILRQNICNTL